jgi:hypothetical protein
MFPVFPAGAKFAHRSNRNGTTDTICRECLATVATATWEAELERAEHAHACDPGMLRQFKKPALQGARASMAHIGANA